MNDLLFFYKEINLSVQSAFSVMTLTRSSKISLSHVALRHGFLLEFLSSTELFSQDSWVDLSSQTELLNGCSLGPKKSFCWDPLLLAFGSESEGSLFSKSSAIFPLFRFLALFELALFHCND